MAKKIYHNAIFLADHRDEEHFEYSRLTLCFSDKGPYLLEDVFTPGSSAGNFANLCTTGPRLLLASLPGALYFADKGHTLFYS